MLARQGKASHLSYVRKPTSVRSSPGSRSRHDAMDAQADASMPLDTAAYDTSIAKK